MDKLEREFEPQQDFKSLDEKLSNHGLETKESLKLRSEIKKFFEDQHSAISQELETDKFSVMVGGSLQAGTADSYSDIDLTIILNSGDTRKIWIKGGVGETQNGIRGIFLFRPDSLRQKLQRDVDINLLSVEDVLEQLKNLQSLETEEDRIIIIDDIIKIFSPQLYGISNIDGFRRSVILKLASMPNGETFWNQEVVPQFKAQLIERSRDEKGKTWPEREQRDQLKSQEKNLLTKRIAMRLSEIKIPNFQKMKELYGI
jgi:hypothetical protein